MQIQLSGKTFEPYISNQAIETAIADIAKAIDHDYKDAEEPPVLLGVLNGAFMFCASLCQQLNVQTYVEFIKISSYEGDRSTNQHKVAFSLNKKLASKHFIIVEDIWDTGATCVFLSKYLKEELQPLSVKIACLFLKPDANKEAVLKPDYVGIKIPTDFVVGYGLDYNGLGRSLNSLYKVVEH